MPLVSRTRATLRSAEFGFFGVCVKTRTQTPRFCGLYCSAGLFVFVRTLSRPLRTSWLIVGTVDLLQCPAARSRQTGNSGTPPPRRAARPVFDVPGLGKPRSRGPAPGTDLPYKVVVGAFVVNAGECGPRCLPRRPIVGVSSR